MRVKGSRRRGESSGFAVYALGFRVQGLWLRVGVWGLRFRLCGAGIRDEGLGCGV